MAPTWIARGAGKKPTRSVWVRREAQVKSKPRGKMAHQATVPLALYAIFLSSRFRPSGKRGVLFSCMALSGLRGMKPYTQLAQLDAGSFRTSCSRPYSAFGEQTVELIPSLLNTHVSAPTPSPVPRHRFRRRTETLFCARPTGKPCARRRSHYFRQLLLAGDGASLR